MRRLFLAALFILASGASYAACQLSAASYEGDGGQRAIPVEDVEFGYSLVMLPEAERFFDNGRGQMVADDGDWFEKPADLGFDSVAPETLLIAGDTFDLECAR